MNKNGKLYGEVNEVHSNRRIGILTCREKAKIVLSFFLGKRKRRCDDIRRVCLRKIQSLPFKEMGTFGVVCGY